MFEIKFVVRDKHLADVLRSVQGVSIEPPVVLPLADEGVRFVKTTSPPSEAVNQTEAHIASRTEAWVAGRGKRIAQGAKDLTIEQVAKKWLDNNPKIVRFVPSMLFETLVEHGFGEGSVAWAVQKLISIGRLKKKPGRGNYEVINASTNRKAGK